MTDVPPQHYCTRCVYPSAAAAAAMFDDDGVCSGCRVDDAQGADRLGRPARGAGARSSRSTARKDGSNYDCLIPVSGGKDTHYQTYVITQEFGLQPLLVTYHGNNYLPVGLRNLRNLRERFGVRPHLLQPQRRGAQEAQPAVLPDDGRHELARPLRDLHLPGADRGPAPDPADHLGRARLHRPGRHVLAQRPRRDDRQVPARARAARLRLARHGRGDRGPRRRRTCCGRATRATRSWPTSACAASTSATTSTGRPTPRPTLMVKRVGLRGVAGAVRAHLPAHVEPRRHARERHPRLPQVRQVRLRPRHRPLVQGHPRRAR